MPWLATLLVAALVGLVAWLDPRNAPYGSELRRALRRSGYRAQREIGAAMRDGRAVKNPQLAALTAAVAQDRMNRLDYRGPMLGREKLILLTVVVEFVIVFAVGGHAASALLVPGAGSLVTGGWVALRRLRPVKRDSYDRLLTAYRENAALAERVGGGELNRLTLGVS